MQTVYRKDPAAGREGTIVKVESSSRPGKVHFVRLAEEGDACSCEHHVITREVCRHIRQARIRQAKATKRCRECGGFGAFWWGATKHGDCLSCFGTGRAA